MNSCYCWGTTYTPAPILDETDDAVIVEIEGASRTIALSKIVGRVSDGDRITVLTSGGNWLQAHAQVDNKGLWVVLDNGRRWTLSNARLIRMTVQQLNLFDNTVEPIIDKSPEPITKSRTALYFDIPSGTKAATCKGCGATIYWVVTSNKKKMCCNPDGSAHWGSCSHASQFSTQKKKLEPIAPKSIDAPDETTSFSSSGAVHEFRVGDRVCGCRVGSDELICGVVSGVGNKYLALNDERGHGIAIATAYLSPEPEVAASNHEVGLPELKVGDRVRITKATKPLEHLAGVLATVNGTETLGLVPVVVEGHGEASFWREVLEFVGMDAAKTSQIASCASVQTPETPETLLPSPCSEEDFSLGQKVTHRSRWRGKSERSPALAHS
jgi:hypothetical protein